MQDESSCTTPSAFGNPPYPTLSSNGSSSSMFTPAPSASRTSEPCEIIPKAFSTHVTVPPFLNSFPFAEEITTGFTLLGIRIVGDSPRAEPTPAVATRPAADPARTNSRRFIFFVIILTRFCSAHYIRIIKSNKGHRRVLGSDIHEARQLVNTDRQPTRISFVDQRVVAASGLGSGKPGHSRQLAHQCHSRANQICSGNLAQRLVSLHLH